MSITISVPSESLTTPAVAESVSRLILAMSARLSGSSVAVSVPVAAPVSAAPAANRPASAPKATPKPAKTPVERPAVAPIEDEDEEGEARYQRFLEILPERSRQFLEMVRERGVLPIEVAMETLDVPVGKAMGGITGSIARWAPEYRVLIPFEAIKGPDGKRAWRWIGLGRRPAPPIPVRSRRRRRGSTSSAKLDAAPARAKNTVESLKDGLSGDSLRFVELLESRGRLGISEVLAEFRMARAQGLSRIVKPVEARIESLGLEGLLVSVASETGERGWLWTPPEAPVTASSEPALVVVPRPTVRVRRRGE